MFVLGLFTHLLPFPSQEKPELPATSNGMESDRHITTSRAYCHYDLDLKKPLSL